MSNTIETNCPQKTHTTLKANLRCSIIIALCFLWTSTGYLTWLYHLLDFVESTSVDWMTEVIGYIFQAVGVFVLGFYIKHKRNRFPEKPIFISCIAADFLFIVLSALSPNLLFSLICGYLMNLFHGIIAGFYLTLLAAKVEQKYRSIVFGGAYAASSISSWLLSLLNGANFLHSEYVLIIYGIFICITIGFVVTEKDFINSEKLSFTETNMPKATIILAGLTVLLVSITRGIGFYFPMADISAGISLEFSRIFYSVGLITAGIIGDKSRKFGAISCLAALFFPFATIALSTEVGISIVLWIIGYIFFGFLAVFRVVIFSDISVTDSKYLYLAGYGLMFGRIGDAAGNLTGIMFNDKHILLVTICSICFIVTFAIFFMLYNKLFMLDSRPIQHSREEQLTAFIQKYELSSRETEVFNLIIEGASNGEISGKLFISENTVKFHIRNILKKTGCANRSELLAMLNLK